MRPIGSRLIEQKLRLKGIHPDVIERKLGPLYSEFMEKNGIDNLVRSRLNRYKSLQGFKLKKKLYDFLLRRGFGYEECKDAVEQAIQSDEEGSPENSE